MEIQFESRWLEKCIRDYLGIEDRAVTKEDVSVIKYLYVSTTNAYLLGFGKDILPEKFAFSDAGDEWWCRCLSDTTKYHDINEFIDISDWEDCKEISIKRELLKEEFDDMDEEFDSEEVENDDDDVDIQSMEDFEGSVKIYEAEDSDFEGLVEDEKTFDYGILTPDDFSYFTNLEVVRLMSCETEIHSLAFLKALPKLRILEVGEVRLNTLDGLEKLVGLEKLCVWAN